ncbi:MAG TPA: agmatinase [Phycisphaerae bacterium]|nr:agmatinase [Phycisphaerae bacterium]
MLNRPGNFLDLPAELSDPTSARYVVLPVPYEGTVTWGKGAAAGPAAILEASAQIEWFDEELLAEFHHCGIATAEPVAPADTPEEQMRRVRAAAEPSLRAGKFLLTLGGEHSVTIALVAAAADCHGDISVLQLDAHADLREEYAGSKYNHACVMRRVLEVADRIAQVGIRSYDQRTWRDCPDLVRNFISPKRIAEDPDWIGKALELLGEKVYVTVDMDAFDPSEAPGVGTPEPGGLHWHQVTSLLRRVCSERQVVAADVVETRPIPPSNVTEFLAARLAYKIIAYTQL